MGYVEDTLVGSERLLYRGGLHWIALFWPVVVGVFVGVPGLALAFGSHDTVGPGLVMLVIGVVALGVGILRRRAAEFAVTDKRVIFKVGIISRRVVEMLPNKIESIDVRQGLVGRMLNFGSVIVRGTGGSSERFDSISHPLEFRRQVQEQTARTA